MMLSALLFSLWLVYVPQVWSLSFEGTIWSINDKRITPNQAASVKVAVVGPLRVVGGKPQPPTFDDIYFKRFVQQKNTSSTGSFSFENLPQQWYSLFSWYGGNTWQADKYQPCGWNKDHTSNWMIPMNRSDPFLNITLNSSPAIPRTPKNTTGGKLRIDQGLVVLGLKGNATTRGYAHGYLLAENIISFFRWFLLETTTANVNEYESQVIPMMSKNITYTAEFSAEIKGMYLGMQASGVNLYVPELRRNFAETELIYANNYGMRPLPQIGDHPGKTQQCSQFSFYGSWTPQGKTITGRNMDGENDLRKTTVSNFVMFAVYPENSDEFRYVSFAWPGFIVVTSGLNEHGVHSMINGGTYEPGPVPDRLSMTLWMSRDTLAKARSLKDIPHVVDQFENACGGGVVIMLAEPSTGPSKYHNMVYECNRFGGAFRYPMEAEPLFEDTVQITNHNLKYGWTGTAPEQNWGLPIRLSSLWRYAAGEALITEYKTVEQKIETDNVKQILKNVCHGTTEHSVITHSDDLYFEVALAGMNNGGWYAPYLNWANFTMAAVFKNFVPQ